MPWNWDGRGKKSIELGGTRGSVQDADTSKAWPSYEAAYLAKRLAHAQGGGVDEANRARDAAYRDKYEAAKELYSEPERNAYLDRITANYKTEADECLKAEFNDWLQGKHEANDSTISYPNRPDQMERKWVFGTKTGIRNGPGGGHGSGEVTTRLDGWKPTWWGPGQLTHLPGVREYLRQQKIHGEEHVFAMNVLAEFGPQNIDQAWAYFKHWVKGRPLSEATCLHETRNDGKEDRAPLGPIKPDSFYKPPPPATVPNDPDETRSLPPEYDDMAWYRNRDLLDVMPDYSYPKAESAPGRLHAPEPWMARVSPPDLQQWAEIDALNEAGEDGAAAMATAEEALRSGDRTRFRSAVRAATSILTSLTSYSMNATYSVGSRVIPAMFEKSINGAMDATAWVIGSTVSAFSSAAGGSAQGNIPMEDIREGERVFSELRQKIIEARGTVAEAWSNSSDSVSQAPSQAPSSSSSSATDWSYDSATSATSSSAASTVKLNKEQEDTLKGKIAAARARRRS